MIDYLSPYHLRSARVFPAGESMVVLRLTAGDGHEANFWISPNDFAVLARALWADAALMVASGAAHLPAEGDTPAALRRPQ